jgi:hypothetical protein
LPIARVVFIRSFALYTCTRPQQPCPSVFLTERRRLSSDPHTAMHFAAVILFSTTRMCIT